MNNMPYYQDMWSNNMPYYHGGQYPSETLQDMYPEIYYRVYPKVKRMCETMDNPNNPEMYPYPTRAAVERMTDDIYREVSAELPYTYEDGYDGYRDDEDRQAGFYGGYGYPPVYGYGYAPGYGYGRGLLRSLVGILLIRELLRRRGIFYY